MRDFSNVFEAFDKDENFEEIKVSEIKLGEGVSEYSLKPKDDLYFKVLSDECGEEITADYQLMSYIKSI